MSLVVAWIKYMMIDGDAIRTDVKLLKLLDEQNHT